MGWYRQEINAVATKTVFELKDTEDIHQLSSKSTIIQKKRKVIELVHSFTNSTLICKYFDGDRARV